MTRFSQKNNWVWPKGHNVQDLQTLRTKLINFKDKGQRLQFGTYIKDKTCNLLLNLYNVSKQSSDMLRGYHICRQP
ncbi:hypothetical protein Hanom_Chr00s176686g01830741 [Helianthus anomalus]